MSLAAATTPSICLSVSAICFTAGGWPMGGAACAGAIWPPLPCATALPADRVAMEAARQTMLNVMAMGRMYSRMGRLLGLDGTLLKFRDDSSKAREMNEQ